MLSTVKTRSLSVFQLWMLRRIIFILIEKKTFSTLNDSYLEHELNNSQTVHLKNSGYFVHLTDMGQRDRAETAHSCAETRNFEPPYLLVTDSEIKQHLIYFLP